MADVPRETPAAEEPMPKLGTPEATERIKRTAAEFRLKEAEERTEQAKRNAEMWEGRLALVVNGQAATRETLQAELRRLRRYIDRVLEDYRASIDYDDCMECGASRMETAIVYLSESLDIIDRGEL